MSFLVLPNTVPHLEEDGSNLSTFATHFREAMQAMHRWGHIDRTNTCPVPKDATCPMNAESEAIKQWEREDAITGYLLSIRLPDVIALYIDDCQTAKEQWNQFIEELCQLGHKDIPNTYAPKGVAHPELDSMREEIEMNAPTHLEGTGPDALMEEEVDHLLEVEEDGAAGKAASVEGDASPHVKLQDPGVSCLAMQENAGSLTLPSPPPPTTLETASTQCSPAANTGTPDIPVPDHGADLEPQPHDTLLPNKAAEPLIHQPPEQTQAPTGVGGSLESLLGKALQRAKGHRGLTSAWTHEGKMPIGEAHGRPPDLPNPQRQSSIAWEPMSIVPKAQVRVHQARRPVPDEGGHTCPDPWPNLGTVIVDPDSCIGSASQLEGKQNIHLPCAGSKLHAAPSAPQISLSSLSPLSLIPPPSDTLAHENPSRGEGAATEQHATEDHHPKPWKPPDGQAEDLHKSGGVSALDNSPFLPGDHGSPGDLDSLGPVCTVADMDAIEVECLCVDAHKQGGALPAVGAAPAQAEGTASVGPTGKAETATTTEPEALAPWAQDKARCGHKVDVPPQEVLPQKGERNAEALLRKHNRCPNKGKRKPAKVPPPEGEHERSATQRRGPTEGQRRPEALPQGTPDEGEYKPDWAPREVSHKDVPSSWEGVPLWDPGGRPPRK